MNKGWLDLKFELIMAAGINEGKEEWPAREKTLAGKVNNKPAKSTREKQK